MGVGTQIHVGKGTVRRHHGVSFGGSYHLPATDTKPERVIVWVWDEGSKERDFELSVGETLEFAGQTWRLDEIDDQGPRWHASFTRIA